MVIPTSSHSPNKINGSTCLFRQAGALSHSLYKHPPFCFNGDVMKVAVLHDYLNQFGGAERVLKAIFELFPDADLYTLLYDKDKVRGEFEGRIKRTSFLDNAVVRRRHRAFIPLMPLAARALRLDDTYDLIISSSAGYAKGFGRSNSAFHVCYCHSPLRYAWEIEYLKNLPFSPWQMHQLIGYPIAHALRRWDKRAADNVDLFIANSQFIADKIRTYYGRDAEVVYPPVDTNVFYPEPSENQGEYYMMAGRLLYYKLFDVGINAFNRLQMPLKIVGSGPEYRKLRAMAGPNIEFIRDVSDETLRRLYSDARAFIFPQIEDFGLVAAEAQACGTPVIAYNDGGAREIVENGKTGVLIDAQTPDAVIEAVRALENTSYDRSYITQRAQKFSRDNFLEQMRNLITQP